MATPAPFQWLGNQAITSPEQAARKRSIAEALIAQSATPGQNWSEGLADVAAALSGTILGGRVDEAETAGRERAGQLFSDLSLNQDPNSIIAALTSQDAAWASPAQTSIASALLSSGLERQDPMYQLQRQKLEQELAMMGQPQQTDTMQNLSWRAEQAGLQPGTQPYSEFMLSGGSGPQVVNNVGPQGQQFANAPFGQDYRRNPDGTVYVDPTSGVPEIVQIPNGPQALEAAAIADATANAEGGRDVATNTIVNAAQAAREAYSSGAITGGTLGNVMANLPESQAAEVRRQNNVLTSNATIQNIQAMRNASPTGAALGALSDKEGAVLQNASGAVDPASPNYLQQLDEYERTLLEIVHGPEAGRRIFEQTRTGGAQWQDMGNGVRVREIR